MTNISISANRVIMRGDKIATEQECCCCPCYVEGLSFQASQCPFPEFQELVCGQFEQAFNNFKDELEAAGYTVNLRALTAEEMPPCDDIACGYEITFSCDSCADEWFEPFFPNANPNPEAFCVLNLIPSDFAFANMSVGLNCPPADKLYPPDGWTGNLIGFQADVQYIPCCGNPLP